MLTANQILKEFKEAGAILKGHFILSSGLHSDTYLQCARVLMYPARAEKLCSVLVDKIHKQLGNIRIDLVASPAMGGVVVGYEIARQLGVPSIFCERVEGTFAFRRGFTIEDNAHVLVVEDVVTTGKSSLETFDCIENAGGTIVAEACLVDRREDKSSFPVPLVSLLELDIKTYTADKLPAPLAAVSVEKPGSRWLKQKQN